MGSRIKFSSLNIRDKLFLIVLPVILFGVGMTLAFNLAFFRRAQSGLVSETATKSGGILPRYSSEVRNMALSALLISGGGGILLYVLLFMALERTMVRPLEALLEGARKIAEDKNFEARVNPNTAGDDEIGQLIAAFNQMAGELSGYYRELESSNRDLARFAYVASHDLQEPLRMVGCFVELLAERYRGRLDQQADEYIRFAVEGVSRMRDMIQGLLEYSRLQAEVPALASVDSGEALQEALANLASSLEDQQARIEFDRRALPRIKFDRSQMIRLWQNLIGNAVRFHGAEKPLVKVSATGMNGELVFSVQDNGIGIEARHQERIFTLFERLNSRSEYPGTGIGLAICKRIVERHGGRIWLDSEVGQGSTFHFTAGATDRPPNPNNPEEERT